MLSTRQLSGLLYSMGHTFDNLSSTYLATDEFLQTDNPAVLGSRSDLALLEDLRDAAYYTLHTDLCIPLDVAFIKGINTQLSRSAALEPGVLRKTSNVMVHTAQGNYIPEIPDIDKMETVITQSLTMSDSLLAASNLFAGIARIQPFGDGNKRTALLAANRLLLLRNFNQPIVVPTEDPDKAKFNELLGKWYLETDDIVIPWLAEYNRHFKGLDEFGHPIVR